jgi:hypothetical protein
VTMTMVATAIDFLSNERLRTQMKSAIPGYFTAVCFQKICFVL